VKLQRAAFVMTLLAMVNGLSAAAPPIYPGAKAVAELNDAAKKSGQDTMAYNTQDAFEQVYEFYKGKGREEPRAHRVSAREKFALIRFKDTGYGVAVSWKEDAKAKGTIIHISK